MYSTHTGIASTTVYFRKMFIFANILELSFSLITFELHSVHIRMQSLTCVQEYKMK